MTNLETRQQGQRSSVFLTGEAHYEDRIDTVRIRNLSEGGAMLDSKGNGAPKVGTKGKLVRRQNEIRFVVKWRQQERYGIEFDEPIDEQEMLIQIGKAERQPDHKPRFRRPGLPEKKR